MKPGNLRGPAVTAHGERSREPPRDLSGPRFLVRRIKFYGFLNVEPRALSHLSTT